MRELHGLSNYVAKAVVVLVDRVDAGKNEDIKDFLIYLREVVDENAVRVPVDRIDHEKGNWQKDRKEAQVEYLQNAAYQSYHGTEVMVEC